jgi:hypothetical protein
MNLPIHVSANSTLSLIFYFYPEYSDIPNK